MRPIVWYRRRTNFLVETRRQPRLRPQVDRPRGGELHHHVLQLPAVREAVIAPSARPDDAHGRHVVRLLEVDRVRQGALHGGRERRDLELAGRVPSDKAHEQLQDQPEDLHQRDDLDEAAAAVEAL